MNLPWADELAIDLGTATIHVCVKNDGVVVREPTVLAYGASSRRPVAYGWEARRMLEHGLEDVRVVQPIRDGVVADFDAAVALLRHCIHGALGRRPLFNPTVLVARPTVCTSVEERALHDALRAAGAGRVFTVQKALAAAIGAGQPVDAVETHLSVDIGAGATDIGAVSMGMLTAAAAPRLAGDYLDQAILRHIKRLQGIRITATTAEEIKCRVGTVDRTLVNGSLSGFSPSSPTDNLQADDLQLDEIPDVVAGALTTIYDEIAWLVEQLPPKARAEIGANGIIVTGGTALLKGLSDHMAGYLGLPVRVATDPMSCTVLGLQSVLNDMSALSLEGRRFRYAAATGLF
ncbi:MAG: rod shape-determining protein [Armatimonadetes bacterium]|nr:rod shape-determining protein [Armatimonadota bacterium]